MGNKDGGARRMLLSCFRDRVLMTKNTRTCIEKLSRVICVTCVISNMFNMVLVVFIIYIAYCLYFLQWFE